MALSYVYFALEIHSALHPEFDKFDMPTKGRGFYLNVLRPQRGGVYARLAQSYWDHGHVKTRVLINFGKVDED